MQNAYSAIVVRLVFHIFQRLTGSYLVRFAVTPKPKGLKRRIIHPRIIRAVYERAVSGYVIVDLGVGCAPNVVRRRNALADLVKKRPIIRAVKLKGMSPKEEKTLTAGGNIQLIVIEA